MMSATTMPSPVGTLTLIASDAGLRVVRWEGFSTDVPVDARHPVLLATRSQLEEYFAGDRRVFDLPLDLVGTEFQQAAWRALSGIPYGTTVTYREQATRIGRPAAVRAVGAANGRNPVPIVLPCHRVIGADGSLTGFGGGLDVKATLLALESGQGSLLTDRG